MKSSLKAIFLGCCMLFLVPNFDAQQTILSADFNDCALPNNWSSEIVRGNESWMFGEVDNSNAWQSTTMDGSCFAYFDDDGVGEEADFSRVMLTTPVFNGEEFANIFLDLDLIFRRYTDLEHFAVIVTHDGIEETAFIIFEQFGGEQFDEYEHVQIDLSKFRGQEMQISFVYDDGNDWGWWVGIDNIQLSGHGTLHDACNRSKPIQLNENCIIGNHENAILNPFSGICADGSRSLWYQFLAPEEGDYIVRTESDFNDVVFLYSGDQCGDLVAYDCINKDEYGFEGESLLFSATANEMLWIQVASTKADFGREIGQHCITIKLDEEVVEEPTNEVCETAIEGELNVDCMIMKNEFANTSNQIQNSNLRARSDVWITFIMDDRDVLEIETQSNFADMISLYRGECGELQLIGTNERGFTLSAESLVNGEKYYVQVSGFFATLEGESCVSLISKDQVSPENDACVDAINLNLDGTCVSHSNEFASQSSFRSTCNLDSERAIWYQFIAPSSGAIYLKGNADFPFIATLFQGDCQDLLEKTCLNNPDPCSNSQSVTGLNPNETYFIMITSKKMEYGNDYGSICLEVTSAENYIDQQSLNITVEELCAEAGRGSISVQVTGGSGNYTRLGYETGSTLVHGQEYLVHVIDDETGCERTITDQFFCPINVDCNDQPIELDLELVCTVDENGQPTGFAEVVLAASGGFGALHFTQLQNGETLEQGSYYQAIVIDEEGCNVIREGIVYCAINDDLCAQTSLDIEVSFTCEYDKFGKPTGDAQFFFEASGGEPGYEITGAEQGQILQKGESYSLEVTDGAGCTKTFTGKNDCQNIDIQPDQVNVPLEFAVYPNPTEGFVQIEWENGFSQKTSIELFDVYGRRLQSFYHHSVKGKNKVMINLEDYAPNVYFVKVGQDGSEMLSKVIKN